MIPALWSVASGMLAQQLNLDVIANNLANVNTTGFKKSRVDFQDLLYNTIRAAGALIAQGAQVPTSVQVGHGVRTVAIQKLFSQGDFQQTQNTLDLVIEGDGFFQITMPDGSVAYTRDGAFKKDSQGRIVNSDGLPLAPEIIIPPEATSIAITSDGTVSVTLPGSTDFQTLGQIQLAKFINPSGLESIGRNLFRATAASGAPIIGNPGDSGFGTIAQGFIEMSNVKVVEEMVNMIVAQRAYEVNARAIQASDDILQIANTLRR